MTMFPFQSFHIFFREVLKFLWALRISDYIGFVRFLFNRAKPFKLRHHLDLIENM